jgi:hypothetical protein
MQVSTWIDRITGEKNLWLTAVRSEDKQDYHRAFSLYLDDASECLKKNQPLKAALSCGSAADCLGALGLISHSRALYRESATICLEEAKRAAGISIREYLWALRESYRYFVLANEKGEAEDVFRAYSRVAKKIDPLGGNEATSPIEPIVLPRGGPSIAGHGAPGESLLASQVERFLQSRRSGLFEVEEPTGSSDLVPPNRRRGTLDEKSIISQLG